MKPTRREILYGAAAVTAGWACSQDHTPTTPASAEPYRFRLAICNETFDGWSFAEACKGAVRTGYEAIEIGPHVLSDDPCSLSPASWPRREWPASGSTTS